MTLQKKFFFTSLLLFILALSGLSVIYFSQMFHLRSTLEQQVLQLSTDYYAEKFLRFHKQYILLASSIDSMGNLDSLFDKNPMLRKIVRKNFIQDLQLFKEKYPLILQIKISDTNYAQSFLYPEKEIWRESSASEQECPYQVSDSLIITTFSNTGKTESKIQFIINISGLLETMMEQSHNVSLVVGKGDCGVFIKDSKQTRILNAAAMVPLLRSGAGETVTLSETEYLVSRVNSRQHPVFVLESLDASRQAIVRTLIFLSLFVIFFSVIILALTHLVSIRITRPIQNLAKQVSGFKRRTFRPLTINSNDEVGALSTAFNTMGTEIQAFTETLESKILARTDELETANKKLSELSNKDALTTLHNRRFFDEKSLEIYELAGRNHRVFCLAIIDIDFFKRLNDRYGHQTGDVCLVQLAKIMKNNFQRSTDYIVRHGGEEFAIFTLGETGNNFATRLENLRREVAENEVCDVNTAENVKFTISIGYCLFHPEEKSSTLHEIIAKADSALYLAKDTGRNRLEVANRSTGL